MKDKHAGSVLVWFFMQESILDLVLARAISRDFCVSCWPLFAENTAHGFLLQVMANDSLCTQLASETIVFQIFG